MSAPALTTPIERPPSSPRRAPAPTPAPSPARAPWRTDAAAGLVVTLVALPLCLGIALASGAPLFSGLITGIVGGLVVSRLSGSQLMVSGPAAGLTAIVVAALAELGSFPTFLLAVLIAGVIQVALGAARLGLIAYFVPNSVIRGMLAGIGLLLVVKQLPYLLGASLGAKGPPGLVAPVAEAARNAVPLAVAIGLASLAVLALWPRVAPAAVRRWVPGPLAAVLLGALVALGMAGVPALALPAGAYVALPELRGLSDLAAVLTFPDWRALGEPAVYRVAATLAVVASLESLLSLEATDKLDPERRTSPANRELIAQGVGNVTASLLGGLPMTGVIVRSAANVGAGARTWRSSFVHGALLLAAVVLIPGALNFIPLAALAAVLIATGIKLAAPSLVADAWRRGASYFVPFAVTTVAIVIEDLLIGIALGLAAGVFFLLRESYRNAYSFDRRESADHHHVRLSLAEEVTFLNKAKILRELNALPAGCAVTVDGTRTKHLDMDVVELLHEFQDSARRRGITVLLRGIPEPAGLAAAH